MERFLTDGHLSDEALRATARGDELPELARLEIAEHLSYCDQCLVRYTALLTDDALSTPSPFWRSGLWQRIRLRSAELFANRYATAAAALIIATTLWSGGVFGGMVDLTERLSEPREPSVLEESLQSWPEKWGQTWESGLSGLNKLLNFGGQSSPDQGGNQS